MALATTAILENVKASIESYVKDNLEGADGLTVGWQDMEFRTEDVDEWIEPSMVGSTRTFHRQVSSTQRGHTIDMLYQIDIFVKRFSALANEVINLNRLIEVRDIVLGRFVEHTKISLKDFTQGGNPEVGKLIVREVTTDQRNPSGDTDLLRWTIAVRVQYLEVY